MLAEVPGLARTRDTLGKVEQAAVIAVDDTVE
jgi:hypothetical protein